MKEQLARGGGGGAGGGGHDEEAEAKIHELEEEQRNTFEERQRLATELEQARKANMGVVMSSMMDEAKEKKLGQMKISSALAMRRQLAKAQKELKKHADLKGKIDKDMKLYMSLQAKHGEAVKNNGDTDSR